MCLVLSFSNSPILCWRKSLWNGVHIQEQFTYSRMMIDSSMFWITFKIMVVSFFCWLSARNFLAELDYFIITDVDKSKIFQGNNNSHHCIKFGKAEMRTEVHSWIVDCAIVTLAHKCASSYLKSGFHKRVSIHSPEIIKWSQNDIPTIISSLKKDKGKCFLLTQLALLPLS